MAKSRSFVKLYLLSCADSWNTCQEGRSANVCANWSVVSTTTLPDIAPIKSLTDSPIYIRETFCIETSKLIISWSIWMGAARYRTSAFQSEEVRPILKLKIFIYSFRLQVTSMLTTITLPRCKELSSGWHLRLSAARTVMVAKPMCGVSHVLS